MFHRLFGTGGEPDSSNDSTCESSFKKVERTMAKKHEVEESSPHMDFAVAIAARVIDSFDCTSSREVKLHADCMRLAIGYPSCGEQKQIAAKYGESKAFISYRVRSIQNRLKLPLCVFNGNRTNR